MSKILKFLKKILNIQIFLKFFFFLLQPTIYFENPKLKVFQLVFAILSVFFVKIDFFLTRSNLFFNEKKSSTTKFLDKIQKKFG
jgi:hypothetical protein